MDMDLGMDSGRQLLRVLVQMVMVNHAPLASQALQLLIRHFSQRKEMVEGFKQVRDGERELEERHEQTGKSRQNKVDITTSFHHQIVGMQLVLSTNLWLCLSRHWDDFL